MFTFILMASYIGFAALPQGYVIECRSCPPNVKQTITLVLHLTANDGTKLKTGSLRFVADAEVIQDVFVTAINGTRFVVRRGDNDTVIVFGPKGQSLKSITFESAEWIPVHRPFYGK